MREGAHGSTTHSKPVTDAVAAVLFLRAGQGPPSLHTPLTASKSPRFPSTLHAYGCDLCRCCLTCLVPSSPSLTLAGGGGVLHWCRTSIQTVRMSDHDLLWSIVQAPPTAGCSQLTEAGRCWGPEAHRGGTVASGASHTWAPRHPWRRCAGELQAGQGGAGRGRVGRGSTHRNSKLATRWHGGRLPSLAAALSQRRTPTCMQVVACRMLRAPGAARQRRRLDLRARRPASQGCRQGTGQAIELIGRSMPQSGLQPHSWIGCAPNPQHKQIRIPRTSDECACSSGGSAL